MLCMRAMQDRAGREGKQQLQMICHLLLVVVNSARRFFSLVHNQSKKGQTVQVAFLWLLYPLWSLNTEQALIGFLLHVCYSNNTLGSPIGEIHLSRVRLRYLSKVLFHFRHARNAI